MNITKKHALCALGVIFVMVFCIVALAGSFKPQMSYAAGSQWPIDTECTICHQKEAILKTTATQDGTKDKVSDSDADKKDTQSKEDSKAVKNAKDTADDGKTFQSIHGAFDCAMCHDDEKLGDLHKDVTAESKMPKRLKKTTINEEVCLACHISYEELAKKTADCTLLTDNNDTTVNPHALPATEGESNHQGITCINCHTMHDGESAQKTAPAKCTSCHHENVFECGTCH